MGVVLGWLGLLPGVPRGQRATHVMYRNDMGVIQVGDCARLGQIRLSIRWLGNQSRMRDLDGRRTVQKKAR